MLVFWWTHCLHGPPSDEDLIPGPLLDGVTTAAGAAEILYLSSGPLVHNSVPLTALLIHKVGSLLLNVLLYFQGNGH